MLIFFEQNCGFVPGSTIKQQQFGVRLLQLKQFQNEQKVA
jgi:hypothetical protein